MKDDSTIARDSEGARWRGLQVSADGGGRQQQQWRMEDRRRGIGDGRRRFDAGGRGGGVHVMGDRVGGEGQETAEAVALGLDLGKRSTELL